MVASDPEEVRQLSQLELMGHLFRRAGFGATRDELEAALAQGYEATLEDLLHPERVPDLVWRMIHTQRLLEEKMVLFWHCLFATGNAKVGSPLQMTYQIAALLAGQPAQHQGRP